MADIGPGRAMKYPYTILGKVFQFPWKHHWKHGRGFRFIYIAVGLSIPIIYPIHKFVNSPGNVAQWTEIRQKRHHDVFAPPVDNGGGHH